MKENERKVPLTDGISRMLESPVDELENQQNFDMNEKSMNDALLREIEKRAKQKPKQSRLAKLSLSPKNSRTLSPFEHKYTGTTPISRMQNNFSPQTHPASDNYSPQIARTQLEPIQQYQMHARKNNRTGGSHYTQRQYPGQPNEFAFQETIPPDIRSESPSRRYYTSNAVVPATHRIKRKQANYVRIRSKCRLRDQCHLKECVLTSRRISPECTSKSRSKL